jgi:hypothetical protein
LLVYVGQGEGEGASQGGSWRDGKCGRGGRCQEGRKGGEKRGRYLMERAVDVGVVGRMRCV